MDRIILHCDLNCFYASVELLSHPDLRQVPMAVCGDPTARHGIIWPKRACQTSGHPDGGDHLASQAQMPRPGAAAASP